MKVKNPAITLILLMVAAVSAAGFPVITADDPEDPGEIERACVPGLGAAPRTEGVEGARYVPWDATGWRRDYGPCAWRRRADDEQERVDREMRVRTEKIVSTVLREARERQVGEAAEVLEDGPEDFYGSHPDRSGEAPYPFPESYRIRASKGVRTWTRGPC